MDLREKVDTVLKNAKSVVFGQDQMLESIIAALVCEGHLLIEGMPGLGKTLSVSTMSKLCDLDFKRVQFTPDLLPSDLIGTMIFSQKTEEFKTKKGPIFTQILLADEINRSPAKVQSALLEAMAEKQVTIGETSYPLPSPFVVLATQNPIEQEGTYQLPEAQLDRFMMKVGVDYPDFEAEKNILDLGKKIFEPLNSVLTSDDLAKLQQVVGEMYVDDKIKDLITRIVHSTRPSSNHFKKKFEGAVLAGASPRAGIWLYRISKFKAFMNNRDYVSPEDVLSIVPEVLGHRIILSYEAIVDRMNSKEIAINIANSAV
jgi:MoxR-like ATPase